MFIVIFICLYIGSMLEETTTAEGEVVGEENNDQGNVEVAEETNTEEDTANTSDVKESNV